MSHLLLPKIKNTQSLNFKKKISADSEAEYQQRSGYFYVNVTGTSDEIPAYDPPTIATADIPKNIDWVAAGAITPVKEQGRCGCSWTLGVCGAIEG